jgi:hypothetical protein
MIIRHDGKDYDLSKPAELASFTLALEGANRTYSENLSKEKARADKAEAERDAARAEVTALKDPKRFDSAVSARVSLLVTAGNVLGAEYRADGKTDRQVQVDVIKKADPKFDDANRTDAYVQARFDLIAESGARADSIVNAPAAIAAVQSQGRTDSGESAEAKAYREMCERNRNAWKPAPAKN